MRYPQTAHRLGSTSHTRCMPAPLAVRIDRTCRLRGRFTLRSGQISEDYFDKYLFEAQPALLAEVAEAMARLVPAGTEVLAGMELGGIPIATMISQLTGLPTVFVRKQAKGYGTNRIAEGAPVDGRRVVIVEDVVTTGGALLRSAADLRAAGPDSTPSSAPSIENRVGPRIWPRPGFRSGRC